jgi:DNA polymerase-3 subunit epsilon
MSGLAAIPESSLAERVLERLRGGPASAVAICREELGLPTANKVIAERIAVALLGADPRARQLPDGRWALAAAAQGSPPVEECAFAVVDVETTGMRAAGEDRVTEIAVVLVHGGRREVVLDRLVHPGRPIPPAIAAITGIDDRMVAAAPSFAELADEVLGVLAGRVFVAHNARFDWGFLDAELRRARGLGLGGPRLCTVRLARRLLPGVGSCGLDNLSHVLGLENDARHRAAGDAMVTARLFERLLGAARGAGARSLDELEALQWRKRAVTGDAPAS